MMDGAASASAIPAPADACASPLADGAVRILGLATASPAVTVEQREARDAAGQLFARHPARFARLAGAFDNAGIDTRQVCEPHDWYMEPRGWEDRNNTFLKHAVDLLERAARDALDAATLRADQIDAIVTICSTGIATPSLDALLMQRLGFRPDTQRLPVFGLGCAGGTLGLGRAAALARAHPGSRVLLLVVELCSLTLRQRDTRKANIIATALFGDGAAAAILTANTDGAGDGRPAAVIGWGEHLWPDTLDIMGWSVEDDGLGVIFSRDIPALVRERMRPAAEAFLGRCGFGLDDLAGVICHPGGAKVIAALEDTFGMPAGTLDTERAVLRAHGNMSAATVMFVLQRRLKEAAPGRYLVSALGPGFTGAFALVHLG